MQLIPFSIPTLYSWGFANVRDQSLYQLLMLLLYFFAGNILGNYVDMNYTQGTSSSQTGDARMQLLENGTLLINSAKETDHGYYLCRASNGIGYPLSRVAQLTVHSK